MPWRKRTGKWTARSRQRSTRAGPGHPTHAAPQAWFASCRAPAARETRRGRAVHDASRSPAPSAARAGAKRSVDRRQRPGDGGTEHVAGWLIPPGVSACSSPVCELPTRVRLAALPSVPPSRTGLPLTRSCIPCSRLTPTAPITVSGLSRRPPTVGCRTVDCPVGGHGIQPDLLRPTPCASEARG